MSIFNKHSAEILILLFFIVTYLFSITEKLANWKGTIIYYKNHFKGTFFEKMISFLIVNIVFLEILTLFLLLFGSYYFILEDASLIAKIGLEISAITLLLFLVGQRVAKDYQGAMNITVYFILNCFGIYLLT